MDFCTAELGDSIDEFDIVTMCEAGRSEVEDEGEDEDDEKRKEKEGDKRMSLCEGSAQSSSNSEERVVRDLGLTERGEKSLSSEETSTAQISRDLNVGERRRAIRIVAERLATPSPSERGVCRIQTRSVTKRKRFAENSSQRNDSGFLEVEEVMVSTPKRPCTKNIAGNDVTLTPQRFYSRVGGLPPADSGTASRRSVGKVDESGKKQKGKNDDRSKRLVSILLQAIKSHFREKRQRADERERRTVKRPCLQDKTNSPQLPTATESERSKKLRHFSASEVATLRKTAVSKRLHSPRGHHLGSDANPLHVCCDGTHGGTLSCHSTERRKDSFGQTKDSLKSCLELPQYSSCQTSYLNTDETRSSSDDGTRSSEASLWRITPSVQSLLKYRFQRKQAADQQKILPSSFPPLKEKASTVDWSSRLAQSASTVHNWSTLTSSSCTVSSSQNKSLQSSAAVRPSLESHTSAQSNEDADVLEVVPSESPSSLSLSLRREQTSGLNTEKSEREMPFKAEMARLMLPTSSGKQLQTSTRDEMARLMLPTSSGKQLQTSTRDVRVLTTKRGKTVGEMEALKTKLTEKSLFRSKEVKSAPAPPLRDAITSALLSNDLQLSTPRSQGTKLCARPYSSPAVREASGSQPTYRSFVVMYSRSQGYRVVPEEEYSHHQSDNLPTLVIPRTPRQF
jgi:hypothetical protein